MPSASCKLTIQNRQGLHARPAMTVAETAARYNAEVRLIRDGQTVDAKSIMHLMMLGLVFGSELVIEANGQDAEDAVLALQSLFENKFGEP